MEMIIGTLVQPFKIVHDGSKTCSACKDACKHATNKLLQLIHPLLVPSYTMTVRTKFLRVVKGLTRHLVLIAKLTTLLHEPISDVALGTSIPDQDFNN